MNYDEILKLLDLKEQLENINFNLLALLCIVGFYTLVKLGFIILKKLTYEDDKE